MEIAKIANIFGLSLEPLHPGVEDGELAQYFAVQIPDDATGTKILKRFRECEAVEAAYVKPPEAAP